MKKVDSLARRAVSQENKAAEEAKAGTLSKHAVQVLESQTLLQEGKRNKTRGKCS